MTDPSGHRIARSRRELVELRLEDLFGDGAPRPPGDRSSSVAPGIGGIRGSGERERWRDDLVAQEDDAHNDDPHDDDPHDDDPHDDIEEDDPFSVRFEPEPEPVPVPLPVPSSGRSGRARAARAGHAREVLARWAQRGRWAQPGRWRIDPERRGALAVMAAILVAGVAVGWQALASRPHAESVADTTAATGSFGTASFATASSGSASFASANATPRSSSAPSGGSVTTTTNAAKVIVDVVGRVHRPGLVTLPAGARVADAIRAAGGALAGTNLTSINLARVCVDGEQIAVGVTGAAAPGPGTASGTGAAPGSGAPGALVNLNTATADQLDALPGVGPVMAQRIIAYRTDHGPFTAVSQLQQVSGIGDAKYADLRPLVTV